MLTGGVITKLYNTPSLNPVVEGGHGPPKGLGFRAVVLRRAPQVPEILSTHGQVLDRVKVSRLGGVEA